MVRLEHTGYPSTPGQKIPKSHWKLLATHRTVNAAHRQIRQEKLDCHKLNGAGTWDDTYRVVE